MEHYNKYYLVNPSEFKNRRARPPPTSYGEQRKPDIEFSYKDLLRELADQSARMFDAAAEVRKRLSYCRPRGYRKGEGGCNPVSLINPFDTLISKRMKSTALKLFHHDDHLFNSIMERCPSGR